MNELKKRLTEYEALRGVSIVLLLILHSEIIGISFHGIPLDPLAKFMSAFLLGSFFFLAGYFMDASVTRYRHDPLGFIKSRIIRIFPPYWIALVFFIMNYTLKRFDMIVYILNLQAVFSPVFVKPLLTLWYISMLVVFYILFGVLLWLSRTNRSLFISSAVLFALIYIVHVSTGLFDPRFFRYYIVFLFGIYFYRFGDIQNKVFSLSPLLKVSAALIATVGYLWVQLLQLDMIDFIHILVVDFFIFTWILVSLSLFRTNFGNWKIWSALSIASYFAYLIHRPLWHFLALIFDVDAWGGVEMFNFLPGSIAALTIGYFLQLGYDRLLSALRLK